MGLGIRYYPLKGHSVRYFILLGLYTALLRLLIKENHMLIVGLSWLVFWLLADVFTVELLKAALATGLIFVILGLLVGELPVIKKYLP